MPRKASGFSKQKSKRDDDGRSLMTEKQFMTLSPFSTFLVQDDDDVNHKFQKNDVCAILPSDCSPEAAHELWQYWIGQAVEIRAEEHEDGTNTVWVKVKWFYNAQDASSVLKSLDVSIIDIWERIESDMYDYVESLAFERVIEMFPFDERDPFQPFIHRAAFFYRYNLGYKLRVIKPKPSSTGCNCTQPYNPNDMKPSMIMHFCPRPSCRRAFHQKCLIDMKSKEGTNRTVIVIDPIESDSRSQTSRKRTTTRKLTSKQGSLQQISPATSPRNLRLLACSPHTDEVVDLASLIPLTITSQTADDISDSEPPRKRPKAGKRTSTTQEAVVEQPRSLAEALGDIPADLVRVAQQPLVRGGAFVHGGITGNLCFVTRARNLVYSILEGDDVPDNWESQIFQEEGTSLENAIVTLKGTTKPPPPVICPNCKSAI